MTLRAFGCKSAPWMSGRELSQLVGSIEDSVGAGRGSRTPKTRRSADFESAASASSAIPALLATTGFLRPAYGCSLFPKMTNIQLCEKASRFSRIPTVRCHFAREALLPAILGLRVHSQVRRKYPHEILPLH